MALLGIVLLTGLLGPCWARLLTHTDMLEAINTIRARVPQASNMERMEWSSELAELAQSHAEGCSLLENTNRSTSNYSPDEIGENFEVTLATTTIMKFVKEAISSWESFSSEYDYESNLHHDTYAGGLYTQLVWATSHLVGCGANICFLDNEQFHILVCDFYPRGNNFGVLPYMRGDSCSQCPPHKPLCRGRLCASDPGTPRDPHFSVEAPSGQRLCFTIKGLAGSDFTLLATEDFSLNAVYSSSDKQPGLLNALTVTYGKRQVLFNITSEKVVIDEQLKLNNWQVRALTMKEGRLALSMAKTGRQHPSPVVRLEVEELVMELIVVNSHLDLLVLDHQEGDNVQGLLGQFFHPDMTVNESEGHLFLPGQLLPLDIEQRPLVEFIHSPEQSGVPCWTATSSISS